MVYGLWLLASGYWLLAACLLPKNCQLTACDERIRIKTGIQPLESQCKQQKNRRRLPEIGE
jgi:hypothetical protein